MRKILIAAGLVLGAALFTTSSTPAQAWVGCTCITANHAPVCVEGPGACTLKMGGACVLPCDYSQPKGKHHHRHHHKKKM